MNEKELELIEDSICLQLQNEDYEDICMKLIAEVRRLNTKDMVYKGALGKSEEALKEVMSWHGGNLEIANWHQNGALEPLDDFIDNAGIEEALGIVLNAMHDEIG